MTIKIKLPASFRIYPDVFNDIRQIHFYGYFPEIQPSAGR